MELSGVGVWSGALRYGDRGERETAAAELESLGYSAIWVPGGAGGAVFDDCRVLLDATSRAAVATGILNLWMHDAAGVAADHAAVTADHPHRFLLGIGISHSMLVDAQEPGTYARPLATTRAYLDALDAAPTPVPVAERALAALGPKMLELARDRTRGAHPYLANAEHTRSARDVLGAGPLLLPEQPVVLETDPGRARELGRKHFEIYLQLVNYTNNLRRLGFTDDDFADGGSDSLLDTLVAWGSDDAVKARLQEHLDAGATEVLVQVLTSEDAAPGTPPLDAWRHAADALLG